MGKWYCAIDLILFSPTICEALALLLSVTCHYSELLSWYSTGTSTTFYSHEALSG